VSLILGHGVDVKSVFNVFFISPTFLLTKNINEQYQLKLTHLKETSFFDVCTAAVFIFSGRQSLQQLLIGHFLMIV